MFDPVAQGTARGQKSFHVMPSKQLFDESNKNSKKAKIRMHMWHDTPISSKFQKLVLGVLGPAGIT